MGRRSKASPFQGRWLGEAGTERLLQICGDLSVSLRLTAPLEGEPWMVHIPPGSLYTREPGGGGRAGNGK